MSTEKASKFAKKGHLVVDADNAKLAVVGEKDSTGKSKKILAKSGIKEIEETVEEKPSKKTAKEKAEKVAKEKPSKEKVSKESKEKIGRAGKFQDNMKIKMLVKENPKRPGTGAWQKFEAYRTNKTVGEWRAAGGDLECLNYDIKREFVAVG